MPRKVGLIVVLAGVLTLVALPAGANVSSRHSSRDVDDPNLEEAYYSLEDAEWHEDNGDDALSESTMFSGYVAGQLDYANDHLDDAIAHVNAAETAGEILPDEAVAVRAKLNAAIAAESRAAEAIAAGDFAGWFTAYLEASRAKEDAEDLIAGYPLDGSVDLGCQLYLSSNAETTTAGLDGCKPKLSRIEVVGGYHLTGISDVTIGSSRFPCRPETWRIFCDDPVEPGQEVFLSFATSPEKTLNDIVAWAADGRVQVIPFTIGSGQPTADTGAVANIFWVTPRGFKPAAKLEQGARYAYNIDVTNEGPGAAFDTMLQVTVPPTFALEYVSKKCTVSGTTIKCPLDSPKPYEGISVSIVGRPKATGPLAFPWTVTTSSKQSTPDKTPNSGTTKANVFAVPGVMIKQMSPSIKLGKPGTISGIAAPNVKKVQVGILQIPANPPVYCAWLGKNTKLKKVKPYAGACDTGVWLDVKGAQKWDYNLKIGLPPGSYYILVRGTNTDGFTGTIFNISDLSLGRLKVK